MQYVQLYVEKWSSNSLASTFYCACGLVCVMAIRLKSKEVAVVLTAKGRIAILALPAE